MKTQIVANVDRSQTRVAILEDGRLAELLYDRAEEERVVGNIYLAQVSDVVPGLDAAFVDCGIEKNAFLHVSDAVADDEHNGRPGRGHRLPAISSLLKAGQKIMVQVTKGPLASKGARATRQIALPGRYLVLMSQGGTRVGVSKRIANEGERTRLRKMAARVRPEGFGIIVRTQAEGADRKDLESDVRFLTKLWRSIENKAQQSKAPALLHEDLSLVFEVVRDVLSPEVDEFIVDDKATYDRVLNLLDSVAPQLRHCVKLHKSKQPVFDYLGIEQEISKALRRKVWLPQGGFISIDQTEALTAVDVNTGKFTGTGSLQETVLRTNIEAAGEIARQLRLRGIGGIIVIDLIDMDSSRHRKQVSAALREAFAGDRMRTRIMHITRLGLVEMTRKRTEANLAQKLQATCPCCNGSGKILAAESVAMEAIRRLRIANIAEDAVLVTADPMVCLVLVGPHGSAVEELERELGLQIFVRATTDIHPEEFEITAKSSSELRKELHLPAVGDMLTIQSEDLLAIPRAGLLSMVDGCIIEVDEASGKTTTPLRVRLTEVGNSYARATLAHGKSSSRNNGA